jgi:hypothetical protein
MYVFLTGTTRKGLDTALILLDTALILNGGSATYKENLKRKTNYNPVPMLCTKDPRQQQEIAIRSFIFSPRSLPSNANNHSMYRGAGRPPLSQPRAAVPPEREERRRAGVLRRLSNGGEEREGVIANETLPPNMYVTLSQFLCSICTKIIVPLCTY